MATETWIQRQPDLNYSYLQKFRLYETRSNFYMIGIDKNRTMWRVLKIDRLEGTNLNVREDSTSYSESECSDLLRRIHEGNISSGGLRFVTTCYGIVGFIKFLGPHYLLVITKRKKIGAICGHTIYAITKSEMIPIPNSSVQSSVAYSKNEKSYKKLLCTVDLTKDFFFSYSYHAMHSLQRNLVNYESGKFDYDTMFVWNEYLTRGIRNNLKNTMWTVALVYGFFKQVKLTVSGKDFKFTLIARRSRHYAGTRYLKRGVNEKGRVANDVETEQIVYEDVSEGCLMQISSVVQNRGSIPLFWSQETSRLNIKPDIILSKKDPNYEATRLHFENLVKRYGNPIIILNLIKAREKKPRESILRTEFANAIRVINKGLTKEDRLRFFHWDLNRHSRNKDTNVLALLGRLATHALNSTGIFYCQVAPNQNPELLLSRSYSEKKDGDCSQYLSSKDANAENMAVEVSDTSGNHYLKPSMFQKGVLRTNCIDCLDRTNVAQYAFGLVALGSQLYTLGFIESPNISLDNPIAEDLMGIYETMGDTLALQYGGSAAHNKIFSERRGQWKAATQSQEFFRTLQRYYSNAYMDAEKQDAINVFLGHFQPQQGKPAIWELDSDQHYDVGRRGANFAAEKSRSTIKRSLSASNVLGGSDSPMTAKVVGLDQQLSGKSQVNNNCLSKSNTEISTCEAGISYPRRILTEGNHIIESDCFCHDKQCNCTNFDMDWLSSSGNSFDEDIYNRTLAGISNENMGNDPKLDFTTSASESGSSLRGGEDPGVNKSREEAMSGYSECFVHWVTHGEGLFH